MGYQLSRDKRCPYWRADAPRSARVRQIRQWTFAEPFKIIALFIVLVYGIAALVLGFSSRLTEHTTLLLIWFLVLFPILVLILFYVLVTRHHTKLYAPHDFDDKDGFFRALTPVEQRERLVEAVGVVVEEAKTASTSEPRKRSVSDGTVEELSTAVLVAEDLVFRELEAAYGRPIRRHVALTKDYQLDGFMEGKRRSREIAIRFTRRANWSATAQKTLKKMLENHFMFWPTETGDFTLVVVADGLSDETIREEKAVVEEMLSSQKFFQLIGLPAHLEAYIEKMLSSQKPHVDFRVYKFQQLKKKYGISA